MLRPAGLHSLFLEPRLPAPVATAAPAAAPVAAPVAAPANGAAKGAPQAPVVKPTPVAKAEGEAAPTTFKIKIDGEVVEMTQAEMERYASKGKFADNAVRQARELAKAAQKAQAEAAAADATRKQRAKDNTDEWLREHGIDPDEFARTRLEKRVAEGKMTPEQREAEALKQEVARLKSEKEARTAKEAESNQQLMATQLERNIQSQLMGAVKRGGMEPGPDVLAALHESMTDMMGLGLLPMDGAGLPPHVADRIVEDAQARISESQSRLEKAVIGGLKGAALKARLGDAVYKQVLADALEEVRSRRPGYKPQVPGAPPPPPAPVAKPSGYIRTSDYDAKIAELGRKHA